MADALHCSLPECMQRITYREYRTWQHWHHQQINNPSRNDYYLMQIAEIADNILNTKRTKRDLERYKLKFELDSKPKRPSGTLLNMIKSRWKMAVGLIKAKK